MKFFVLFVVIAVLCLTAQAGIKDSRLLRVSEFSSLTLIRLLTLDSIILTAATVGTCSRFGSRMVRLQGQYWTDEFQSGATFKVCDTLPENFHEGISWPRRRRAKIRIVQGDRCANQQTQREIQERRSVLGDGNKSVHWHISERIRWLLSPLSQTQNFYTRFAILFDVQTFLKPILLRIELKLRIIKELICFTL